MKLTVQLPPHETWEVVTERARLRMTYRLALAFVQMLLHNGVRADLRRVA